MSARKEPTEAARKASVVVAAVVVLAAGMPVLAVIAGLSWRLFRWIGGLT